MKTDTVINMLGETQNFYSGAYCFGAFMSITRKLENSKFISGHTALCSIYRVKILYTLVEWQCTFEHPHSAVARKFVGSMQNGGSVSLLDTG
jgi:uncharacterized membrane protein YjdF